MKRIRVIVEEIDLIKDSRLVTLVQATRRTIDTETTCVVISKRAVEKKMLPKVGEKFYIKVVNSNYSGIFTR